VLCAAVAAPVWVGTAAVLEGNWLA
jgi:hypothetical protein